MKTILHLPLKEKWYRMIKAGIKTEEYREINAYWTKRLAPCIKECSDANMEGRCLATCKAAEVHLNWMHNARRIGPFTHVHFTLGYPRKDDIARNMICEIDSIRIDTGNPDWGAEPNKHYFVIKLKRYEQEQSTTQD